MQSPIIIDSTNIVKLNFIGSSYYPFKFNYPPTSYSGDFVDKSYQILYSEGRVEFLSPNSDIKIFETQKIEIHAPAEHFIKGKQKALELHIIHKEQGNNNIMIVSILFKISSNHNEHIQNIIDGETTNIHDMIGNTPELYVYFGSLTSPPCSETVLWAISSTTQKISYEQVKYFSSKWENNQAFARGLGNNRAIQPLNNRVVFIFH